MIVELKKAGCPLKGELTPPPDKSISHRAAIFAAVAKGTSLIRNYLPAADTISTLNAMKALGVEVRPAVEKELPGMDRLPEDFYLTGSGLHGLKEPGDVIDCGNSGTTTRLLAGLLSGNPVFSVLTGDDSLKSRPMGRVIVPLSRMGASIGARGGGKYLPMAIKGGGLNGIIYEMPVASAQVKSAVILAGLYADGKTTITEPGPSRDHTERMLASMGARIEKREGSITVEPGGELSPFEITVPGDISSAAFFIVAALLVPGSELLIKNTGINPTRTGILNVLARMGADITMENVRDVSGEPVADLTVKYSGRLKAFSIDKGEVPLLIDEVPILCIAAAAAEGVSEIRGAEELRVKESDRIKAMADGLMKMGIEVEERPDGLGIKGGEMTGASVESFGDHRIAMSFAVASLIARGATRINNADAVGISYPEFFFTLGRFAPVG